MQPTQHPKNEPATAPLELANFQLSDIRDVMTRKIHSWELQAIKDVLNYKVVGRFSDLFPPVADLTIDSNLSHFNIVLKLRDSETVENGTSVQLQISHDRYKLEDFDLGLCLVSRELGGYPSEYLQFKNIGSNVFDVGDRFLNGEYMIMSSSEEFNYPAITFKTARQARNFHAVVINGYIALDKLKILDWKSSEGIKYAARSRYTGTKSYPAEIKFNDWEYEYISTCINTCVRHRLAIPEIDHYSRLAPQVQRLFFGKLDEYGAALAKKVILAAKDKDARIKMFSEGYIPPGERKPYQEVEIKKEHILKLTEIDDTLEGQLKLFRFIAKGVGHQFDEKRFAEAYIRREKARKKPE